MKCDDLTFRFNWVTKAPLRGALLRDMPDAKIDITPGPFAIDIALIFEHFPKTHFRFTTKARRARRKKTLKHNLRVLRALLFNSSSPVRPRFQR